MGDVDQRKTSGWCFTICLEDFDLIVSITDVIFGDELIYSILNGWFFQVSWRLKF